MAKHELFKSALVVNYSSKSDAKLKDALLEQGIAVREHDCSQPVFEGEVGTSDLVICIHPEKGHAGFNPLDPDRFFKGVPLVTVDESVLSSEDQSGATGLLSNLNNRSRKSFLSVEDTIVKTDGVTIARMKRALDNNEFELWYQPVIARETGKLSGFEALVRWKDADTGTIVVPDRFIPTIESDDLVIPFGFWIINEACRQSRVWNDAFKCDPPLVVGINLSARQFTCGVLVERIIEIIRHHAVDPASIALEITESAFMDDMESANIMLLKLRAEKVKIYLDDFGTGFSSLSYLLHFPVDVIKIDKSFVKWMHVDEQSEEIVKSIIGLAHNLKMKVVAEGVEEEEHIDKLAELGCDFIQGFYYSKPLDPSAATAYIAAQPACRGDASDKSS